LLKASSGGQASLGEHFDLAVIPAKP
jgi:hypothetical protein